MANSGWIKRAEQRYIKDRVMKALILLLLSFSVFAEHELNVSYLRINQNLEFEKPIRFKMDAVQLGYTYWTDYNVGFKLAVARSTETPSSVIETEKFSNKINALWKAQLAYRYNATDNLKLIGGAGITEYHASWWVSGVKPPWGRGTDSFKPSWFVGFQYHINKNVLIESTYGYEYKKMKQDYGEEKTDSFSIGLSYIF